MQFLNVKPIEYFLFSAENQPFLSVYTSTHKLTEKRGERCIDTVINIVL